MNVKDLVPVDHKEERVLTSKQVAEAYGVDKQIVTDNFNNNKSRYTEGKHYYKLTGVEKTEFLNQLKISVHKKDHNPLYLWTKKGAFLHSKSIGTDQAWEMYEELVDFYFDKQEQQPQKDSYMIEDPIARAERWIEEAKEKQQLQLENKELQVQLETTSDERDYAIETKAYISDKKTATTLSKLANANNFIHPKEGEYSLNYLSEHFGCYTNENKLHPEFIAKVLGEFVPLKGNSDTRYYRSGVSLLVDYKTNIVVKEEAVSLIEDWILNEENVLSSKEVKGITIYTYKFVRRKQNSKVIFNK
jgi:hypothetical protein